MLSSPYVKEFAYIPGHHHLSTTTYRTYTYKAKSLDHLVDQLGHVLLPVSGITTLDVASELSRPPSTSGVGELEGPKVGGSLLEVGSASSDLVNQVLHTWTLVGVRIREEREGDIQMIPNLPSCFSMIWLSVMGIR
jgi:hypothetical protein